ncbi:OLC1v1025274C1 [Oldenlandia corymbosa var. corymbosa]|uniref:OLC1v1025274C1 n=1 Tax=Oldenlandia corymbosa var. corymbosa TaxID=529605 RepID=A0AAV1C6H6_OLDCO|nr:OLC1v1025274C1 [Oldenlandia corymbosa var. corymbosa]
MGSTVFFTTVTALIMHCFMSLALQQSIETDKYALLALKSHLSFGPDNIFLEKNWTAESSVCGWYGVACDDPRVNRVTGLSISCMGLTGSISSSVGNLSFLHSLDLSWNSFHGNFPEGIALLQRLQHLDLSNNLFSGAIPPSIFVSLSNLQSLRLKNNTFSGNVPMEVADLHSLTVLDLQFNLFSGPIPLGIFNLSSLEILAFTGNKVSGNLPMDICSHLPRLNGLYLWNNEFDGPIPASLGNCSQLEFLILSSNAFSGILPGEIGNLSSLVVLDIGDNQLTGSIPSEIGHLHRLQSLSLGNNWLSGIIPETVGGSLEIQELILNDNRIVGTIPDAICNLRNLSVLHLGMNSLGGYLPPGMGNLKFLRTIDLSRNSFTGKIPASVGTLPYLVNLSLAQNEFEGSIPEFQQIMSLETLDLSQNNLTGGVPQSLEALLYLKWFNVSYNRLSGQIPTGGPFRNFTASSFMSNAGLCGAPQFEVLPCSINHSKRRAHLIMHLFLGIFPASLVTAFLVFLFIRNRKKKIASVQNVESPDIKQKHISYSELQTATNRFGEGNLLALGSYSAIYECCLSDGTYSAVKVFHFKNARAARETFLTECDLLSRIRHRNLIEFIASCPRWDLDIGAIVLEYMPNGSLERWLYSHNYCLDISQRLDIMIDVASALDYLHNNYYFPVVHCDVKPGNVLLDEDMVGHLCDFGIAKLLSVRDGVVRTKTMGTVGYIAPDEIMQVVDCNLLRQDHQIANFEAEMQCVSTIMELALQCTATSPGERMNIQDVVSILKKLRSQIITQNCDRTPKSKRSETLCKSTS